MQTEFADGFSDAGLVAVAISVIWMTLAVDFPVVWIYCAPVFLVFTNVILVMLLVLFLTCAFLFLFAGVASAGNLAVAKARIGNEGNGTKRAAVFFSLMVACIPVSARAMHDFVHRK